MFVGGFECLQHHFPARRRVGLGPVAAAAHGKVRPQRDVGVTGIESCIEQCLAGLA